MRKRNGLVCRNQRACGSESTNYGVLRANKLTTAHECPNLSVRIVVIPVQLPHTACSNGVHGPVPACI